jgi:hypothetical protein
MSKRYLSVEAASDFLERRWFAALDERQEKAREAGNRAVMSAV